MRTRVPPKRQTAAKSVASTNCSAVRSDAGKLTPKARENTPVMATILRSTPSSVRPVQSPAAPSEWASSIHSILMDEPVKVRLAPVARTPAEGGNSLMHDPQASASRQLRVSNPEEVAVFIPASHVHVSTSPYICRPCRRVAAPKRDAQCCTLSVIVVLLLSFLAMLLWMVPDVVSGFTLWRLHR
jgi:hypothetical protein